MAFSIVLGVLGLGMLCTLLYRFTVYALPAFVGLSVGFWAIDAGADSIGGVAAGSIASISALVAGQLMFTSSRSPLTRGLIALMFATPAGYAAYQFTLQLSQLSISSTPWQWTFAGVSALAVGGIAVCRLALPPSQQIQ